MLAGYGEVDFTFALCTAKVLGDQDTILRAIFRMQNESARVKLADTLIRPKLKEQKLIGEYSYAIGCVKYCLKIRNQYAHCHWADDSKAGLFFTNLEDAAKAETGFDYEWRHVDVELLEAQQEVFIAARNALWHIENEYLVRTGKLRYHAHPMPKKEHLPKTHNPPDKHPAPWKAAGPT